MNKLVIIGASGHGKVVADIAGNCGYRDILFLDDNPGIKSCGKYPVLGTVDDTINYRNDDFIVAIGNAKIRCNIQTDLENSGCRVVDLIHPGAVIAEDVTIGSGTVIMAGAVINPGTTIGKGCIINTSCSIDHDCNIGDFAHISVGSHLAGTVAVGEGTWIGIGAAISNNINVGAHSMIGAGTVVIRDIPSHVTAVGNPARIVHK